MNNLEKVYLIFHRNRLSLITMSDLDPALVLYRFLKSKNMVHLVSEFSVGIWDSESDSRGGIDVLYYGLKEDMHE